MPSWHRFPLIAVRALKIIFIFSLSFLVCAPFFMATIPMVLTADTPLPLVLPHQWIWDMLDEFVYHFQTFHQYRLRLRTPEEIAFLKANPTLWDLQVVTKVLTDLIEKSSIIALLQQGESALDCAIFFTTYSRCGSKRVQRMPGFPHG